MEKELEFKEKEISAEDYESLLNVRLADITSQDLKRDSWFTFSLAENYTLYITDKDHVSLSENHGINLNTTLTEGYFKINLDKKITT